MYTWIKYCIRCIVLCRGIGKQTDRFELNWNRYISRPLLLTLINDSACIFLLFKSELRDFLEKRESISINMASRINRVASFPFPPYLILTVFQLSSFSHVFIKRTKISKADLHFSESCSIIPEYDPLDHDRLRVTYSASLYVERLQRELWKFESSFYEWFIRKLVDFRMNILSDGYSSKRWVLVFLATVLYS